MSFINYLSLKLGSLAVYLKMIFKKDFFRINIATIILLSVVIRIFIFFDYESIWWDSAVYIGIGKALFSFGQNGLWEDFRPLLFSLFLGLSWKLKIDPLITGKVIELISSIISVFLVYKIGEFNFGKRTGLIASVLLSFSPIFFFMGFNLYVSIPATALILASIYSLQKQNFFSAGIFMGLSILTKFTYIIMMPILFLYILIRIFSYKSISSSSIRAIFISFIKFSGALGISLIPFSLLNLILYNNPLHSFLSASSVIKKVLICNYLTVNPWNFYLVKIFSDNPLNIIFFIGLSLIIFEYFRNRNHGHLLIVILFITPFIYLHFMECKIYRYMIIFIPFLSLITAYTIARFTPKRLFNIILFYIIVISITLSLGYYFSQVNEKRPIIFDNHNSLEGYESLFVSSPWHSLHTDKRLNLLYYPVYDSLTAKKMFGEIIAKDNASIFVDLCPAGIMCSPSDSDCIMYNQMMMEYLEDSTELIFNESINGCDYRIYLK